MRIPIRVTAALLLSVVTIAIYSSPAFAAESNAVQSVTVRLVSDTSGGVVLVSGELPRSTRLPARILLAVPTEAEIVWSGEILGGDPSKDPKAEYERTEGKEFDTVSMTLKESRVGQVEYRDPAAVTTTAQGQTARVSWVSPVDAATGQLSIEVPQGAQVSDAGGAQPDGTGFYTEKIDGVKAGDKLELQVVYTAPAAAAPSPGQAPQPGGQAPAGSPAPASPITLILVAGLLVGGTLFALRYVNRRQQGE